MSHSDHARGSRRYTEVGKDGSLVRRNPRPIISKTAAIAEGVADYPEEIIMSTNPTPTEPTLCADALPEWERELLGLKCCGTDHDAVARSNAAIKELRERFTPVVHEDMLANQPRQRVVKAPPKPDPVPSVGGPTIVNALGRSKQHAARLTCEMVRVAALAKATNRTTSEMVQVLRENGEFVKDGRSVVPAFVAKQYA